MPRTSLRRWAVTSLVAALLGVPALPAQAAGDCPPGVGIGLVDVVAGKDPRGRVYVVDALEAGQTITRRVRVCNGTQDTTRVGLHAGAAVVEDGEFRVLEGQASNELTSWTTVEPGEVTVRPGESVLADVTVRVPEGAEDGERLGVVLASMPGVQRGGAVVVERVGVRMYLAVGRATTTDFTVRSLQAVRDDAGRPLLRALVRNTGRRAIDPVGDLQLSDGPGGTRAGPFPVAVGTTIGPGEEHTVLMPLDPALAAGPWRAVLAVRAGGVERRVEATVTWPAAGEAAPVRAHELDGRGGTVALAAGLVLLLTLLVLVLLLLARRRRREDEEPAAATPAPAAPTPAPAPVPAPVAATVPVVVPPLPPVLPVPLPELPRGVIPAPRNAAVRRALAARSAAGATEQPPRP